MKKCKGIIDPWTIGLIISIFGGATGYIIHPPGENIDSKVAIEKNQSADEYIATTDDK